MAFLKSNHDGDIDDLMLKDCSFSMFLITSG